LSFLAQRARSSAAAVRRHRGVSGAGDRRRPQAGPAGAARSPAAAAPRARARARCRPDDVLPACSPAPGGAPAPAASPTTCSLAAGWRQARACARCWPASRPTCSRGCSRPGARRARCGTRPRPRRSAAPGCAARPVRRARPRRPASAPRPAAQQGTSAPAVCRGRCQPGCRLQGEARKGAPHPQFPYGELIK